MAFKDGVNISNPHIAEAYEIIFADGATEWHFTPYPVSFPFDGNTYTSAPISRRGGEAQEAAVKVGTESITLGLSDEVRAIIDFDMVRHRRALDRAEIKIYQIDMDDMANYRLRYNGFTGIVRCNEERLVIDSKDIFFLFKKNVPTDMYGENCNLIFGSSLCGVALAGEKVSSTTDAGSDTDTIVDAALAQADGFFDRGYVEITSGALDGEKARVKAYTVGNLELMPPFLSSIGAGVTFDVYPHCQKTYTGCAVRANTDNFFGFQYIPKPEEVQI